ncbi:MAG: hypothetical protein NC428_13625 [Clostridium sp.]|nr:hypothetical protein [Clostridium sp.]
MELKYPARKKAAWNRISMEEIMAEKMKKQRVAIYCRIGNPADDGWERTVQENPLLRYMATKGGGAAALPLSRGEIQKFFAQAGQKAMDEVLSGSFSDRTQIKRCFPKV